MASAAIFDLVFGLKMSDKHIYNQFKFWGANFIADQLRKLDYELIIDYSFKKPLRGMI